MVTLKDPRELRGLGIVAKGDAITQVSERVYYVKAQSGDGEYRVERPGYQKWWTCTCPDFSKRKAPCKHVYAVFFSRKLRTQVEAEAEREAPPQPGSEARGCPRCCGQDIIRKSKRATKHGPVQRYLCRGCNLRFVMDQGFSRMKNSPEAVTACMDLFFKGLSYRKVRHHLKQFYGVEVEPSTLLRWVRKFSRVLATYADQHKAEVGQFWHSDEMALNVRSIGGNKRFEWLWNLMDGKTRFLLACRVTGTRYAKDARKPIRDALDRADKRPKALITDGLQAYIEASRKELFENDGIPRNPHVRVPPMSKDPNRVHPTNNILERLNGTVRERVKVQRGLQTEETAQAAMDGFRAYYNLVRPHMGLGGLTPAEMVGIPIPEGGNRWMALIEEAAARRRITSTPPPQAV